MAGSGNGRRLGSAAAVRANSMNNKSVKKSVKRNNAGRIPKAVSNANVKLILAEERERTRIAQELHDHIGVSLAVLGIDMLRAGQPVSGSPGKVYPGIHEVYEKMQEISKRVSRLSHQLHSPALEYLGMAQAVKTECRVFSEESHIPVACSCRDIAEKLDQTVGQIILRVLREALSNAARHGGASKIDVEAAVADARFILVIRDNGSGFEFKKSLFGPGLGLFSMMERVRLIGGELQINSSLGRGTELVCRVPLS